MVFQISYFSVWFPWFFCIPGQRRVTLPLVSHTHGTSGIVIGSTVSMHIRNARFKFFLSTIMLSMLDSRCFGFRCRGKKELGCAHPYMEYGMYVRYMPS